MYRAFGKLRSDKRGFTLVELTITMSLMLLVLTLSLTLFSSIYKNYKKVEDRYILQTEVNYIMSAFEQKRNIDAISSAFEAAVFYDDALEADLADGSSGEFPSMSDLGRYSFSETNRSITFEKASQEYSYIFCINGYVYVLNAGTTTANRFYFYDEVPIDVGFEVSKSANPLVLDPNTNRYVEDETPNDNQSYLNDGVRVVVTGHYEDFTYQLDTSYAFKNFVKDNSELNYVNGKPANNNIAGWTPIGRTYYDADHNEHIQVEKNSQDIPGFPTALGDSGKYENLTKKGNVLRYYSETSYFATKGDADAMGFNDLTYKCAIRNAVSGSQFEQPVIDSLHSFRDNVLKGTKVGDWAIDKYYNVISPELVKIENSSPLAKNVIKYMLVPTAKLLSLISN